MAESEQKLNISQYFIMSSPTGEVNDVVTDVQKLVNDPSVLTEDALRNILKEYNQEQLTFAPAPSGTDLVMVSAYGRVDDTHYINPNTNQILAFNHKTQKFTEAVDGKSTLSADMQAHRNATQKAIDAYCKTNYANNKWCAAVYGHSDGKLTICISAKNIHLSNFWTGGWRAVFHVPVNTPGSVEVKATIKVNVHYFEDGNVQLHSNIDKATNANVTSDANNTATELAKAVAKLENEFQSALDNMYMNMGLSTMKQFRRFANVMRQPMNWMPGVHALAQEVAGAK